MQTGKSAAASAKESAANVAASAKSGMDKTKANVQEKAERMTARDPMKKDMATEAKQEKIRQAEYNKQEARENNAAARQAASTGGAGPFTAVGRAQNTTHGYASGGDGLHTHTNTHPTGTGHNPDYLTGSGTPGYVTGQHTHNVGGVNTGQQTHKLGGVNTAGADAMYPDDTMGSGPNTTRNTVGGAPGMGHRTGGTYQ